MIYLVLVHATTPQAGYTTDRSAGFFPGTYVIPVSALPPELADVQPLTHPKEIPYVRPSSRAAIGRLIVGHRPLREYP